MEKVLKEILSTALGAADPGEAVCCHLRIEGDAVLAGDASFEPRRVFVLAAGNAAGAMARAAGEELLGDRIGGGLMVYKEGTEAPSSTRLEPFAASRPEPDERSLRAAKRAVELLRTLEKGICFSRSSAVEPPRCSRTPCPPSGPRT